MPARVSSIQPVGAICECLQSNAYILTLSGRGEESLAREMAPQERMTTPHK